MSAQKKHLLKWRVAPLVLVIALAIALVLGFSLSVSATTETETTEQFGLTGPGGGGPGGPLTTNPPVKGSFTVNLTVVNLPAGVAVTDLVASIKGPNGYNVPQAFNGSGQIVLSNLDLGEYEVKNISCSTDPYDFYPPVYNPSDKVTLSNQHPNKSIGVTVTWPVSQSDRHDWTGNGGEWNVCEYGGNYHWVFTTGGTDVLSAHLYVTYDDDSTNDAAMGQNGNGSFDVWLAGPDTVKSAYVIYTYLGGVGLSCVPGPGNMVLTISESQCNLPLLGEIVLWKNLTAGCWPAGVTAASFTALYKYDGVVHEAPFVLVDEANPLLGKAVIPVPEEDFGLYEFIGEKGPDGVNYNVAITPGEVTVDAQNLKHEVTFTNTLKPPVTTTTCQPTTTTCPPQTTTTAPCQTTTTNPGTGTTVTTDRDKNPLTGESDNQQSQRQFMWLWIGLAAIVGLIALGVITKMVRDAQAAKTKS